MRYKLYKNPTCILDKTVS